MEAKISWTAEEICEPISDESLEAGTCADDLSRSVVTYALT